MRHTRVESRSVVILPVVPETPDTVVGQPSLTRELSEEQLRLFGNARPEIGRPKHHTLSHPAVVAPYSAGIVGKARRTKRCYGSVLR